MRAREWEIAGTFRTPGEYGIPEIPDWKVCEPPCGGIAFAADGDPFIVAEQPMKVRR